MSKKEMEEISPRRNNTISIDILYPLSMSASKYSNEIVNKHREQKISGAFVVKVTAKNPQHLANKSDFERYCKIHINETMEFVYG